MQPTDDSVLLRQYAENHSDEAFAKLVTRHINLVYSVAIRCVGDPHQAEEVAQAVFVILAKKAMQLRHDRALSSWLFQTTRLTASNFVRGETRRHRREQEAHMQSVQNDSGSDIWPRIAPFLDEAVAGLNENDRHAIMLRFYEGRNLREVGVGLGTSEDAAEKRVSRAVEKLRGFFAKRDITVGASGLVVLISANAVQAAPIGLAVTISTAAALAGTAVATTATAAAIKAIAMTTIQKAIVGTTLIVAVGTGIYETRQASLMRTDHTVQISPFQPAPSKTSSSLPPPPVILGTLLTAKLTNDIIEQYEARRAADNIANLIKRLNVGDANAVGELVQLGETGVIPLSQGLTNSKRSIRAGTLTMLGFMAQHSYTNVEIVLPAMFPLINDPDLVVRTSAVRALGNFTTKFDVLEPYLRKLKSDESHGPEIQEAALDAWRQLKVVAAEQAKQGTVTK